MKLSTFNLGRIACASMLLLSVAGCVAQVPSGSTPSAASPELPVPLPSSSPTAPSPAATPLPAALRTAKLTTHGFGAIRIGMTVQEAAQATGTPLVALAGGAPRTDEACSYVRLQNASEGLEFMLNRDRLVRIDVRSQAIREVNGQPVEVDLTSELSQITTQSGAKLGDTEAQLQALYSGQLVVTPHKYVPTGHYLTFIPEDAADANYRLIFETDGSRVTSIRAGRLPEVEWVERCS